VEDLRVDLRRPHLLLVLIQWLGGLLGAVLIPVAGNFERFCMVLLVLSVVAINLFSHAMNSVNKNPWQSEFSLFYLFFGVRLSIRYILMPVQGCSKTRTEAYESRLSTSCTTSQRMRLASR
jgi:hypothetical protein